MGLWMSFTVALIDNGTVLIPSPVTPLTSSSPPAPPPPPQQGPGPLHNFSPQRPPSPTPRWPPSLSWRETLASFLRDGTHAKQQDRTLSLHPPWSTAPISCLRCSQTSSTPHWRHDTCQPASKTSTIIPVPKKTRITGHKDYRPLPPRTQTVSDTPLWQEAVLQQDQKIWWKHTRHCHDVLDLGALKYHVRWRHCRFFCRDLKINKIVTSSTVPMFIIYIMQIWKFYTVWALWCAL